MKVEINLKGEIEDKIFIDVKTAVEKLKGVMSWYKLEFKYEEFKKEE